MTMSKNLILTKADLKHLEFVFEELLFRLKEDDMLLISDLEDEILTCCEIIGLEPDLAKDNKDDYGY